MLEEIARIFKDISLYGLEKLGRYYSTYRGFVYDNEDPNKCGRLLVSVPEVFGDNILNTWAWPASMYSGKNYGMQCLPRKNDMIWVTFEKGNPRKPIWSYGYFGKGELPQGMENPNLIWFITPKQNKMVIDDEAGTIKFISHKGKVLQIDDKISLGKEDGSDHPVALGDTTKDKLDALIDIVKNIKVNTLMGPQPILPLYIQQLEELKATLDEIKSTQTTTQ